jgi:hypothetical protein
MKLFIPTIFLCVICLGFSLQNPDDNQSVILWNDGYKLKFDDFIGECDSVNRLGKTGAVSTIEIVVSGIEYPKQVTCFFDKSASWFKNKDSNFSELLLSHEQLHFDIGELYARRIRKSLDSLKSNNEDNFEDVSEAVKYLFKLHKKVDSLYDIESAHGKILTEQLKWKEKIFKELNDLDYYTL